jgi:prolyl 4-hydroxylase
MSKINERLARITHVPIQHQEDMQILRYEPGQHYLPHTDFFSGQVEKSEANGLQRLATVLIGLNAYGESYDGGETTMPMLPEGEHQKVWKNVTECTRGMLAVRFKKGDALLFYSLSPDGQERVESTHGSCDVISGTKYSAPIWIRQRPFHIESLPPDVPTVCADKKSACADWASKGECDKNPSFMRNECPKSCDACL